MSSSQSKAFSVSLRVSMLCICGKQLLAGSLSFRVK
jgi:hypothetical protein